MAKQQAEKAVILLQGSLIFSEGLNDAQVFKRIIGDLATELLLSKKVINNKFVGK